MAGNKVNAKAKGKDDRGKGSNKPILSNNDDIEDTDFSLLRKPIQTSITGFAQARKIFDMATEELKGLLSDECDLLYECKVCRNLFRSVANFISHKRIYCKDKFNTAVHGHFIKSASTVSELAKIKQAEEGYLESLKTANETESMDTVDVDERIPLTKDLTTIIEKIAMLKGIREINEEPQVTLQKIPNSAVAVFQNVDVGDEIGNENMRAQVNELDDILSRNVAVLQNDGKFNVQNLGPTENAEATTDGVIQISDDDESLDLDDLKCKKCDMQFSTQKTLRFHMKYKHVDTRMVYPCPDCLEIFSTSWSVYRHLFKVHRKTAAQIRRLRESIQAKAFKMNNPPAFYEKRKNNMKTPIVPKITEEERIEQENQAWMDNMECDGEVPRCGGCGRTFERRAALAAHTHTCQPRSRALARRPETKRIEIQIRKDYNKGPAPALTVRTQPSESKTTKDGKEQKESKEEEKSKVKVKKDVQVNDVTELKIPEEVTPTPVENTSKSSSVSPEKVEDKTETPAQTETLAKAVRLPFAQHSEKSNLMALRQRIIPDIELENLRCKKCDEKCGHIQELYDHVAKHYNWMRYACKLCNFKHYNFDKLPEHVKVVHKLKGDKDFYFSTVKALDGTEALELATPVEEANENEEVSPNSRRPSRCSSDSSRLSDDSSSSTTRVEGSRKRKVFQRGPTKIVIKRRKSVKGTKDQDDEWTDKNDSPSNVKAFDENSSDLEEPLEKVVKKSNVSTVALRRPVRRKAKPKNADFEYDLSNLLKMEAQGYRESQTVVPITTKSSQTKKKSQQEILSNYEMLNKECCGALVSMSRKTVEISRAHMKTNAVLFIQKDKLPPNIFVRPMLPRNLIRSDKLSPKKDNIEEKKDSSTPNKESPKESTLNTEKKIAAIANKVESHRREQVTEIDSIDLNATTSEKTIDTSEKIKDTSKKTTRSSEKTTDTSEKIKDTSKKTRHSSEKTTHSPEKTTQSSEKNTNTPEKTTNTSEQITNTPEKTTHASETTSNVSDKTRDQIEETINTSSDMEKSNDTNKTTIEKTKPKSINIPSVVPLKFRRPSLDVMKNPIINKNISEFTKAGMKTKILVIKPINRNKDGTQTVKNTQLKFQTIKLKETGKSSSSDDKSSDQVVVVKVPKVDCVSRTLPDTTITKVPCEKVSVIKRIERTPSMTEEHKVNTDEYKSIDTASKSVVIPNSEINGDVKSETIELTDNESRKNYEINNKSNEIASPSVIISDSFKTNKGDDTAVNFTSDSTSILSETKTEKVNIINCSAMEED